MSKTKRQSQTMKTSAPSGYVRILAPPFEQCPKCHESNTDTSGGLWRVSNAGGLWLDCAVCAYYGRAQ